MFYTSNWFEQATIGDALVEYAVKTMMPSHFDLLDDVVDYFNNWASVDWLCLHGLQSLLLQYLQETLLLLKKWNCSDSVLKRRECCCIRVENRGQWSVHRHYTPIV